MEHSARSLLGTLFADLQDLPAERLQQALSGAQPVGRKIARYALADLHFDDGPYDYAALLKRSAPRQ